jgi:hypothetical protein
MMNHQQRARVLPETVAKIPPRFLATCSRVKRLCLDLRRLPFIEPTLGFGVVVYGANGQKSTSILDSGLATPFWRFFCRVGSHLSRR